MIVSSAQAVVKAPPLLSYMDDCDIIVSSRAPLMNLFSSVFSVIILAKSPLSYQENIYLIYAPHTSCFFHI